MKIKWLGLVPIVLIVGILILVARQCSDSKTFGVTDTVNADGVRDDVAIAIREKFPMSEKRRAAATQLARVLQKAVTKPNDAMKIFDDLQRASACLASIESPGPGDPVTESGSFVEAVVVNSFERSKAYIHFNAKLSGQVSGDIDGNPGVCDFDLSKMAN